VSVPTAGLLRIAQAVSVYYRINIEANALLAHPWVDRARLRIVVERAARVRRIIGTLVDREAGYSQTWGRKHWGVT